jgi:flagellar hook-associated protein 1 FlgK
VSDFGLSIAASGLNADTAELDTASNNLSNINTPGYAQEVVNLSPEAAAGPLQAGRGVTVASVSELTDAVYESANVAAEGVQGAANQTNQVMSSIEAVFPEPTSDGLSAQLSTFWSDLSTLAANPNQAGAQQTVAADAGGLAEALNSTSTQLSQLSSSLQSEVGTGAADSGTLAQVNQLLNQVAQLNQGIVAGDSAGQNINALSDERRSAVDQLAGFLGISTSTTAGGALTINSGGVQLVSGDIAQTLVSTGSAATENLGIATSSGVALQPSGSIGADLTAVNSTLPGYQAQLSAVANALAGGLNALQANGMAANGDPGSAIAGGYTGTILPNIFVDQGSTSTFTPSNMSAATIAVSSAYLADPSLIATAAAPGPSNSNVIGTPTLDSANAQAMAALAGSTSGPDTLYRSLIGTLGTQASDASGTSTAATNLATTAAGNLASISGVNQNQQEVDILSAQNAFQAASQAINAINQSFQSLLQAV